MAGQADAIKGAGKLAVGVYKWARTTPAGRGTAAAAIAGAVAASEKKSGHANEAGRHHATEGVTEHIAKPVVDNLISFLRKRK